MTDNTEQQAVGGEDELIEKLAAIEHERWCDWQRWMHEQGKPTGDNPMDLVIPEAVWKRWQRQIDTPYAELSEAEKQSDRDQVMRYWPLISRHYIAKEAVAMVLNSVAGQATDNLTEFSAGVVHAYDEIKRRLNLDSGTSREDDNV